MYIFFEVLEVYEVWHYEQTEKYDNQKNGSGLFTSYVNAFLELKQAKSGFPTWVSRSNAIGYYVEMDYFLRLKMMPTKPDMSMTMKGQRVLN